MIDVDDMVRVRVARYGFEAGSIGVVTRVQDAGHSAAFVRREGNCAVETINTRRGVSVQFPGRAIAFTYGLDEVELVAGEATA